MRRHFSRHTLFHTFLGTALLVTGPMVSAQSLGEIAKELQDQKAANPPAPPAKVITNNDLPKDPNGDSSPPAGKPQQPSSPSAADAAAELRAARQRAAEQRAAAQWKQRILAQEAKIANLQARADELRASIQAANPNGTYQPLVYTRYQLRQLQQLKQTEAQIDRQQQVLEDMQDAARHAGMHTAVYDP